MSRSKAYQLHAKAVVWYAINPTFTSGHIQTLADVRFGKTHNPVAVIDVAGDDAIQMANDAYMKMQGENWSPFGEARPLIQALGLKHTSMSVGDIVVIVFGPPMGGDSGRATFVTDMVGFRLIE